MKRPSVVLLSTLLLAACSTSTPPTSADVVGLNGTVLSAEGKPVSGAVVTILRPDSRDLNAASLGILRPQATTAYQTTTDASGRYRYPDAPSGTYNVFAQQGSLSGAAMNVSVSGGATTQAAPVRVTPPGTVTGTATLQGLSDHEGVDVFLSGTSFVGRTNGEGKYTLSNVPAGTYRLVAQAMGYTKANTSVTVTSGGTITASSLNLNRVAVPAPSITGVSSLAAVRGRLLTITGTNFGAVRGNSVVTIGGADVAQYVSWSNTQIQVRVPRTAAFGQRTLTVGVGAQEATRPLNVIVSPTQQVSSGYGSNVAVRWDGTVVGWGNLDDDVFSGLSNIVAISLGGFYSSILGIRTDGTVVGWGDNRYGQTDVPAGLSQVVALAVGWTHSLAVRADGTVVAWGSNVPVPAELTQVVAVSAGRYHNLALKVDGTVAAWGGNDYGQTNVPAGLDQVVAVSAGWHHSLALRTDGTVAAWGHNEWGQTDVPAGLTGVVAVAAGQYHSLALKADGTVVGWGDNWAGALSIPTGLTGVVAIAAGNFHSLAVKWDGTVIAWGANNAGQTDVPAGLVVLQP